MVQLCTGPSGGVSRYTWALLHGHGDLFEHGTVPEAADHVALVVRVRVIILDIEGSPHLTPSQ